MTISRIRARLRSPSHEDSRFKQDSQPPRIPTNQMEHREPPWAEERRLGLSLEGQLELKTPP